MADSPVTRAAIYVRQSLDVQEGIDRQRLRCRKLAEAREWVVVEEYVDNDTSATKVRGASTAWSKMLEAAAVKRFDVVIAVDLDRLLRQISDLVTLMETGVKVLTVDGEIDITTADGEFRATMLAAIARFETRRKSERQMRANLHAATQGRPRAGRRAFGYDSDGMTIRPDEAEAIRDGYRDLLLGVSLAAIARDWNSRGFTTGVARYKAEHKGEPSPWADYSVRHVLLNPRNVGKRVYKGEIVADAEWPAIVDETTFLAVQAVLKDPSRKSAPRRGRMLLSGLALCGVCRETVHAGAASRRGKPSYRCGSSLGHFARMAEPVEEFVGAVMVARLSKPDALELLTERSGPNAQELQLKAVGLRARMDTLAIEFAEGNITASMMRKATEHLRTQLEGVEAQLVDAGRLDAFTGLVGVADVGKAWSELPDERKRAVIDALAVIVLYPPGKGVRTFNAKSVGIEWRA